MKQMIISIFPQVSEQQHEKQRAAVVLLMVSCTMLFCSPATSFEGKSRFKSALTSVMVYLEQPKHNTGFITYTSFLEGYPCVPPHANQVMRSRIPLN